MESDAFFKTAVIGSGFLSAILMIALLLLSAAWCKSFVALDFGGATEAPALASHSGRTSADGSAGLMDGGSCHAHTVDPCPAHAAGRSDFRDVPSRLKSNRRGGHRLRRYRNRQSEASNCNQPDHSVSPLTALSLRTPQRGIVRHSYSSHKLPALVARRLEMMKVGRPRQNGPTCPPVHLTRSNELTLFP